MPFSHEIYFILFYFSASILIDVSNIMLHRMLELSVTSHTLCEETVENIKQELNLQAAVNTFGIFECCGSYQKFVESKVRFLIIITYY